MMFFVTVFNQVSIDAQTKVLYIEPSRVVGYYTDFNDADTVLKENICDVHETIYHYAVIEEIEEGVYPVAQSRWFYKYDKEKDGYYPIDEPAEFKHYSNIALG